MSPAQHPVDRPWHRATHRHHPYQFAHPPPAPPSLYPPPSPSPPAPAPAPLSALPLLALIDRLARLESHTEGREGRTNRGVFSEEEEDSALANTNFNPSTHHHHRHSPNPCPPRSVSPSLPSAARPLLLTLHCLFSAELLPALDILDRGAVRRYRGCIGACSTTVAAAAAAAASSSARSSTTNHPPSSTGHEQIYLVACSASSRAAATDYVVCLRVWHCSCAAFAAAVWAVGAEVPVCKHLLACLLGTRCPGLFGGVG